MNRTPKVVISIMVLVIVAFSSASIPAHALVAANTLNIAGSSTVLPIALEASVTFPTYWNSLVAANNAAFAATSPFYWGDASALDITSMNIQGEGSGTVFPAILPTTGNPTADIGEMSRPPSTMEMGPIQCRQRPDLGSRSRHRCYSLQYRHDVGSN